ncbi:MAG: glycine cleavage system aminomethyltransferase GcvT [Clostridia bacterium]|nr:glycine cleavage system aminomethyltransferase GcvT [Clostridia bacterium]
MKKTPINELHKKLGGRLIDFGGWELPVQYTSIIEEHTAVRENAGIFDVSHMGEIEVKGNEATSFINYLITNDISAMTDNQVMYSPMCYEDGGCVDDLLVYKKDDQDYLLIVNASNTEKDYEWIISHSNKFEVKIANVSDEYAQIAVQGPKAEEILQRMTETDLSMISFYTFKDNAKLGGCSTLISRTGYTGEDGFEIYLKANDGEKLFTDILENGKEDGLIPCGLGARDTLRFESALPLYGHELSKEITPVEAMLTHFIKTEKTEFIGKESLQKQLENKSERVLIGFEMVDKGVARNGYDVFDESGREIGVVTSGSFSPTLKLNLGMAIIKREFRKTGTEIYVDIRGKKLKAEVVKKPFYIKKYKK